MIRELGTRKANLCITRHRPLAGRNLVLDPNDGRTAEGSQTQYELKDAILSIGSLPCSAPSFSLS